MAYNERLTHQISGNTLGATANILSGAYVIAGGNNITLSQNANTVTIIGAAGGAGGGIAAAAGSQTQTSGTVLFNDGNGITFGMSNSSVVTASHNGLTSQSNQALSGSNGSLAFQTATFGNLNGLSFYTSNGSMVGSYTVPTVTNSVWTVSDNATSGTVARLAFTNQNGLTLSLSTGAGGSHTVVGSHNGLTSQSNQAISAANGSFTFQTATFANSNGISFSTGTQGIFASHNGLTTARASNDAVGLNTAQSNVTWTVNSSGISLDGRGYAGTGTSATNASITLNSNGLAISVAAPGAAAENNWVNLLGANTAGNTTASGSTLGLSGINLTLSGTNGSQIAISAPATSSLAATGVLSISTNGNTISIGVGSLGAYAAGNTTQSSSGTVDARSITFRGGGDASVGVSNGSVVVSVPSGILTSQSNQALSGSNGSFTFQTATFGNLNGLSFYTSNGSLVGSHNGLTTARASNDGIGLNTAQSNVTWTVNSSGLSFDGRGYAGTGTTFAGANVSGSLTLNSAGLNMSLSAGAGGGVTPVASASNGSFSFTTLAFSNANNVTFGTSAGSIITASVAAPGAAAENNYMNLSGNTAGNTTASGSTINFSGINITLSGTNGSQIAISAPATSALQGTGQVSISTNGSTISIGVPSAATLSMYPLLPMPQATSSAYSGASTTAVGGSQTSMSGYVSPLALPNHLAYDVVEAAISFATVAGTGSFTARHMWGVYTDNAGTLSSLSTYAFNILLSQNSVTAQSQYFYWGTNSTSNSYSSGGNISGNLHGLKMAIVHSSEGSFSPGQYYLAYAWTMSTAGAAIGSFSNMFVSQSQSTMASRIGSVASIQHMRHLGIFSRTVSSANAHAMIMPASINSTAITGTGGSSQNRYNNLIFANL